MRGIGSAWGDTPAAQPAPLFRAAAAAHVVAAFAFVGWNFAARAMLACVFDELQRRLFRCHVVASPLRARLVGMRVAVRKTIYIIALALDAGLLDAGGGAHGLASAADADVGIFGLGLESLVFVECFCVDRSVDEIPREIAVADGTKAMQVSLVDLRHNICSDALHANLCMPTARQRRLQSGSVVIAADQAREARLRLADQTKARAEHVEALSHDAACRSCGRGGR